jgi:PKD repeat protein
MLRLRPALPALFVLGTLLAFGPARAQSDIAQERIEARAVNKPLESLGVAAQQSLTRRARPAGPREIPNFRRDGRPAPADAGTALPDAALQESAGTGNTVSGMGFPGASNNDNGTVLGYLVAPPDTDGEVGPSHFVQMINSLTTIFDKNGSIVSGPFASNAIWQGIGNNCEAYNQGDPIVLYDEQNDRWLASQFAFPDNLSSFSQCVAISQTGDPTGAWNRYEFSFDGFGFNDYPKHGIVDDSITMIANLFRPRGPFSFSFAGTFLGVMDKAAMYAGQPATLIGFNIGKNEFGFVAGDLDGPGSAPALFATAMSTANALDIWRIDVDWGTQNADAARIASVPITPYDSDLCSASREACIPQPNNGPALEAITDRLMHRLQLRDFGAYRTMVTSHTVDVGSGRSGIRWYELRESNGTWALYQEGTYGPGDGQYRWMPSVAMNGAGDIGLGYLLGGPSTFVSTAVTGQSAASSGSGLLDSSELICSAGTGVQEDTGRSGDYSATSIDPGDDSFWHTNEVFVNTGQFQWSTFVCNFTVGGGGGGGNNPPNASFTDSCNGLECSFSDGSTDTDGTIVGWDWDFGDGNGSTAQNPSHVYAAGGTYAVTLTVTDDDGATDTAGGSVTPVEPGAFTLTATGRKERGLQKTDLSWDGATTTDVDIFRDGGNIATTANDGAFTDNIDVRGGGSYVYQICESGTSVCSNTDTVVF